MNESLVGAKHPIHYDAAALSARIAQEPLKTALRATWYATNLNGLFAHYVAGDALTRAVATPDPLGRLHELADGADSRG